LDEVVIVSYGKQRNTPVSVIDGEELSEFPNTDIGQALQGRAAGRYDVLNTQQHIQFLREINALFGQNGGPDDLVGRINDDPTFNGNGVDTDWQDAYFRQAPIYNISATLQCRLLKTRPRRYLH